MPGSILAEVTSDNTAGGSVLTAVLPVLIFVIVAVILYLRFSRPHRRVPARVAIAPGATRHAVPDPDTARAAAVAAGLPTAAGGGAAEAGLEPAGAARESAADDGPSNVSDRDADPAPTGGAGQDGAAQRDGAAQDGAAQDEATQGEATADGTEAGE
jgi:hypothetical protein